VDEGIGFADVAPFLIISSASWADASKRLGEGREMDVTKFRPTIVVEGAGGAWEEDYWGELSVEGQGGKDEAVRFVLTQNCARCNSLNVDYETGKVGVGPEGSMLKLLSKDRRVDPGSKWSPIFGRYGFLGGKDEVSVSVGDSVVVTKKNEDRMSWGKCHRRPELVSLCLQLLTKIQNGQVWERIPSRRKQRRIEDGTVEQAHLYGEKEPKWFR
jgi:uncharacterized protein YcbX